jgi:succinate dehydrogenase / fumarate reductase, membrane anchor subunit
MKTALGKVRGSGSAKNGTHHWWMQRVTAIGLLPLVVWLLVSLVGLVNAGHSQVITWISSPFTTLLLILFIFSGFYHAKLGLQVVIEDYVHTEGTKIMSLLLINFACISMGLLAIIAILKTSFGSYPS